MNDPNVVWIPTSFTLENIQKIWEYINYPQLLFDTVILCVLSSLIQVVICCLVGYGFARFDFKLKGIFMAILILTVILPPQVVSIPNFLLMSNFNPFGIISLINVFFEPNIKITLLDTPAAFYLPALTGMGIRSGVFIIIFRQFFRGLPKDLEDAASVDGSGPLKTFAKVMLPNCIPAVIVVLLFSMVWYWNDTYYVSMYFDSFKTVSLKLIELSRDILRFIPDVDASDPFAIVVWLQAGAAMSAFPMLILYLFCQKYFVESIERTGIVG